MARMTNEEIRAAEGGDFGVIDDNYSDRQVEVAIASRAGKAVAEVEEIKQEVEGLKNNPDVVDIVDTYADLQAYDKSKLTDKDVIRVLNDETHDGNSTYYRYSKSTDAFIYIGSSKAYDVFTGTDGTTAGTKGLVPAPATTDAGKFLKADGTWSEGGGSSATKVTVSWNDLPVVSVAQIGYTDGTYIGSGAKWVSLGELCSFSLDAEKEFEDYEITITDLPDNYSSTVYQAAFALPPLGLAETKGVSFATGTGNGIGTSERWGTGILYPTTLYKLAGGRSGASSATFQDSVTLRVTRAQTVQSVTYTMYLPNVQNDTFVGWNAAYVFGLQTKNTTWYPMYDGKYISDTRYYSLGYYYPTTKLVSELYYPIQEASSTANEAQYTANQALRRAVKSNWDQNDSTQYNYVENRPFYDTRQPNISIDTSVLPSDYWASFPSSWNSGSGDTWNFNIGGDAYQMAQAGDGAGQAVLNTLWLDVKGDRSGTINLSGVSVTFAQYGWSGEGYDEEIARETITYSQNARINIYQDQEMGSGWTIAIDANQGVYNKAVQVWWEGANGDSSGAWQDGYMNWSASGMEFTEIGQQENITPETMRLLNVTLIMGDGTLVQLDSKFIKVDGSSIVVNNDGELSAPGDGPTVVQTTGTSTTDVMSQKATTDALDGKLGTNTTFWGASYDATNNRVTGAITTGDAVGRENTFMKASAMALGFYAGNATAAKMLLTPYGLSLSSLGIHDVLDPTLAQDAATKNYTDNLTISYAALNGSAAPTTATEAKYIGQLYYDTTNSKMYYCSAITTDTSVTPNVTTYTWSEMGGGLPATTTFWGQTVQDGAAKGEIFLNGKTRSFDQAIGADDSSLYLQRKYKDGSNWYNSGNAVAMYLNRFDVGSRRITSLTDPNSPQDAATKNYVDTAVASAGAVAFPTSTFNSILEEA